MSDLPNRDELEARLAKTVGKALGTQLDDLLDALGDPPDPNNLPYEFWEGKELRAVIEPLLINIFLVSAETLMIETSIGIEWGLVNQRAIDWVSKYTFELVRGINDTTREILRSALDTYFRDRLTLKQLIDMLSPAFGPVRAEMIAITEVTRAAVNGELSLVNMIELDNRNIKMIPNWQTANDDRVCPICGPKHGKVITDGEYPPAHPRCRCWVNHEMTVIT